MTAESHNINFIQASPGWLENFLRRSPVETEFKLYGKANSRLPYNNLTRMEEIRQIAPHYYVSNIYNMDKVFYSIACFHVAHMFNEKDRGKNT